MGFAPPLVGIGASAGGLEAFSQLLRDLPSDTGMAFVLVQHLDPTHVSRLPEVLTRTTTMPVLTVTDGLRAESDHVYVIPPNTDMTINGGAFSLTPRSVAERHAPIDHFFSSLAREQAGRAIGVVLSGTGSDGTLGLQAIKAEGGITFVQDERSAKHPGMPQSAASVADFVLPPAGIARELARIGGHPYVTGVEPVSDDGEADDGAGLGAVLHALRTATGVDFAQYKPTTVRRRVARRMLLQRFDDVDQYAGHLRKTPHEAQALHDDLLIQVTALFRDPDGFEALRRDVFPRLVNGRSSDDPIRIWVPGCATGEEAYSLVISLLEFLEEKDRSIPIQMFATDLSAAAIARARTGTFSASLEHEVSPERLRRFFLKVDGRYQISKAIRDACVFAQQNVITDPPFSKLDLISCCNVLIYLSGALQERVIPVFHYALKPSGFLRLGASESIGRATSLFAAVDKRHRIYARKPGPSGHLGFGVTAGDRSAAPAGTEPRPERDRTAASIERDADRLVLGRYAPAGVVVDAGMQIVQFRGKTGPYLEAAPGAASFDLLTMAREGLASPLRRAIQRVGRDGRPVKTSGVRVKTNGGRREIGFEVIPLGAAGDARSRHHLVLFFEERSRGGRPQPSPARAARPTPRRGREVARLAQELAATRHDLQTARDEHDAAMEDLRAATEEAQSSNEELQSTNEELETAKEELQATNEELTTVNDELNSRNAELAQLSSDLGNLLSSTHVPIVMVGGDLRVRRMTPVSERILNMAPGDVGRAMGDLRLSIEVPDLEALVLETIQHLSVQEREVVARDGRWYSVRVRPYRTADNRIDGAVISFVDIDAIKRGLDQAREARDQAQAVMATVREPLVILDSALNVVTANQAFYETFQTVPKETNGCSLFGLGNGRWDIPELRAALAEVLPRDKRIDDLEVEQTFDVIGRRTILLSARRVLLKAGEPALILLAVQDVTERRRAEEAMRRLGAIVEGSEDAIVGETLDGVITSWNRGAEQMFEYRPDEAIGRPVTLIIPPERLDEEAHTRAMLRRGQAVTLETVRVRKSGGRLDMSITISPIRDAAGRLTGASKIARDITERKRIERERAELLALTEAVRVEVEEASQAKDRFVAVLSHELRTPLSAMLGWVRMLRTHHLDEAASARALEVIERNTLLQVRLIEDLLDVSRIVAGTLHLERRDVMLEPLVEAVVAMMRPVAEAKGVRLESQLERSAGPVHGDPARLQQIVWNLVANSIKFTPSGGRVEVQLARREADAEITVRDTGIGIAPNQLADIFGRFRAAQATSRAGGGLGLGLAIVHHLVDLHGGAVRADSGGAGQGATFTVTLPLIVVPPGAEVPPAAITAGARDADRFPALDGIRALVVEDDTDTCELLRTILARCGATVTAVTNARAALDALHQTPFDVLVSDIAMPGANGYDLIREVRTLDAARGGGIPALALTAFVGTAERGKALAAGFQKYVIKPIEPADLAAAVASLVGRRD